MSSEKISTGNEAAAFTERFSRVLAVVIEEGNYSEEQLKKIRMFESTVFGLLSAEVQQYLQSLDDDSFQIVASAFFRHAYGETWLEKVTEQVKALTVDNVKNIIKNALLRESVNGYGHPDLKRRQKENPIPAAAELMMGCYIEQIEVQTRNAVIVMRSKGYDTVQSGFFDEDDGSQFFDIDEEVASQVPDVLVDEMMEKYAVKVEVKRIDLNRTYIILTPDQYKDVDSWREALDYFAEAMPTKGKEVFNAFGLGVNFAFKAIKQYPMDAILTSAVNDRQRQLVKELYQCKTKADVIRLFVTDPDKAEQLLIRDALESDNGGFGEVVGLFSTYSHVIDSESIAEGIDLIKQELDLLTEKYSGVEEKKQYLVTIERALRYLKGRLEQFK
jgi:hypothetical protein